MDNKNRIKSKSDVSSPVYDFANRVISTRFSWLMRFVFIVLSPTWYVAILSKRGVSSESRAKGIIARNYFYLCFATIATVFLGLIKSDKSIESFSIGYIVMLSLFLYCITWSRCNEILFAFIIDALDKTKDSSDGVVKNKSNLTYRKRIKLSLLSYIELILNFALIYFMMPASWFGGESFNSVIDAVYFSGVTITTLGYGDYTPTAWLPQLLILHQVLTGFTLVIVSFAVYAGKGLSSSK